MDKLAELKKQLLEDEKQNSLSTLNEMISLIPEINGMIAERAKLRDDFYRKNYPGKNIYFAPDNPPGEEYEQFEKKFVEKLNRFKFVFLKANRVLKNKCGIHINNAFYIENNMGKTIKSFEEITEVINKKMHIVVTQGFGENVQEQVGIVDESGKLNQRLVQKIEKINNWTQVETFSPIYEVLNASDWDKMKDNVERRIAKITTKINEAKAKGLRPSPLDEDELDEYLKVQKRIEEVEAMEKAGAEKPKAGDSISFVTESKGKTAGKARSSKEKSNEN